MPYHLSNIPTDSNEPKNDKNEINRCRSFYSNEFFEGANPTLIHHCGTAILSTIPSTYADLAIEF